MTHQEYQRTPIAPPSRRGGGVLTLADTGRIAIAVFIGSLAALIAAALLAGQYVGHAWDDATSDLPGATISSGLTRGCEQAIRAQNTDVSVVCAGQDRDAVRLLTDQVHQP